MTERLKILVVDDEAENLDLLQRILHRRYDVSTALDAAQALEIMRRERFAAIVSDQRMPGMTGVELLAEARRIVPDTVRLILTGYSAAEESLDAINVAHVNAFLTKPVRAEAVARAVDDAVETYLLSKRNQELIHELAEKNRELHEAKRLLEMSLDERTRQLLDANRHLESLALRDSLTGLYNHRFVQERMAEEIARARRHDDRVSLVLADIDRFRVFNETNGHPEGDKLLIALSRILQGSTRANDVVARIRPTDMVARFGGEEFVVIVPGTAKLGAARMCERIQETLRGLSFAGQDAMPGGRVTMSFGIAEAPGDADTKGKLLDAAETALIRAKQGGRDRIEIF